MKRERSPSHEAQGGFVPAGSSGSMRERRLTVSAQHEPGRARWRHPAARVVPLLRLRGAWLSVAGFESGQRVRVKVGRGRLVVTIEPAGER